MQLPRKFRWLAAEDNSSTHLELRSGVEYSSSSVYAQLLKEFEAAGKLAFLEDDVDISLPKSVFLEVQKGTIGLADLIARILTGRKES